MLTLFQKIRLLEAILLATQILQMIPTLVNSLAKRKSIQWIKRLQWALIYARLSLKTQSLSRSAIANLPTEIRFSILESKAMFRSFDLWYKYFKKLVTTTIPDPDDLDESDNIFIKLDWEEHFGSSLKVYEKKHPFPSLLVNYEDGTNEDDRYPDWLS